MRSTAARSDEMNFWIYLYRFAWVVFVALVLCGLASIFLPTLRENQERQRRASVMEEEIRNKEEAIQQLRRQRERFLTDPKFVEDVAREEFGKARSNETVFRFPDK